MATPVWISLGSNLGDRQAILDDAILSLGDSPGLSVRSVSSYHETNPIGGPIGQGPFLNAAAHLETTLDPFQLLTVLQRIEDQAGRVRVIRWGERSLDLDILIFGTKFLNTNELKLPHPRLAFRRFVLEPLVEIAPKIVDTVTKRSVADLLCNLDRQPRFLALEGPIGSAKSKIYQSLQRELVSVGISEVDLLANSEASGEGDPDLRGFLEFERKAEALLPEALATICPDSHWLVVDYCLSYDLIRANNTVNPGSEPLGDRFGAKISYGKERKRADLLSGMAVAPTFVVHLPGYQQRRRQASFHSPELWPESEDPEAIVAEVIATCRGIEAI